MVIENKAKAVDGIVRITNKQRSSNDDWEALYNDSINIPKANIEFLAKKTIMDMHSVIKKYGFERIAYCWSGGKDSLVMYDLIRRGKVPMTCGGVCVIHDNEFPSFEAFLKRSAPVDVEFRYTHDISFDLIEKDIEYLFPNKKKYKYAYTADWRKQQFKFYRDNNLDVLFTGRRTQDGNICRKNKHGDYIATNKLGVVKYDPLAEWKHEDIMAYIRHHNIILPEIYFYPNGFRFGTHPWTERRRLNGSFYDTFDEIMLLEPTVLLNARGKLSIVDEYFNYRQFGGLKR